MNELFWNIELLCWDNEGAGDSDGAGDGDGAGKGAGDGDGTGDGAGKKTFTQEEVNRFVAERNKNLKAEYEKMEASYKDLLSQQNLTNEQREKLEANLQRVQEEMMSKEQRLEAEKKKAQKEYETKLKETQDEAEKWRGLYENSTIDRAITDAASQNDAFNPTHFIAHLAPKSKMVEEVDAEGNVTGKLVPRVEWTSVDDKGQKHVAMKTPEEAITMMKENVVEFGNLFKTNVAAGIGAGTAPGQVATTGEVNHSQISTDDYMELAKTPEGRKRLGLSN